MDPSLFDPLTLVFSRLSGIDLFSASLVSHLWNRVFQSDDVWRSLFLHNIVSANFVELGSKEMPFRERFKAFLSNSLITEITVGGPAYKDSDGSRESVARNAKVPYTIKSGLGVPEIPFPFVDGYQNACFGELDVSKLNTGKHPIADVEAFARTCGVLLQVLGGKGRKPPKETDPLPPHLVSLECELRGLSLVFGFFFNPDDISAADMKKPRRDDGFDFILSHTYQEMFGDYGPAHKFALYLVFRHVKKFMSKTKKQHEKKTLRGFRSRPYEKTYYMKWRIVRQLFCWDTLEVMGRSFREDMADVNDWQDQHDLYEDFLIPSSSFLKWFSIASKSGKIGKLVYETPLRMKDLFNRPSAYSFDDNSEDLMKEVLQADLKGEKIDINALKETPKAEVNYAEVIRSPDRVLHPPDYSQLYAVQIATLKAFGYSNDQSILSALTRSRGVVESALNFLADEVDDVPQPVDLKVKYAEQLAIIKSMGITDDEAKALSALDRARGNVDHAVAIIFGD